MNATKEDPKWIQNGRKDEKKEDIERENMDNK